jgi:hypothetical protein
LGFHDAYLGGRNYVVVVGIIGLRRPPMISLETAKALRDAGLLWEPRKGIGFSLVNVKNVVYHGR